MDDELHQHTPREQDSPGARVPRADSQSVHIPTVEPGSDNELFEPTAPEKLERSALGAEFELLEARQRLLELSKRLTTQSAGMSRRELTSLMMEAEALSRATQSLQIVLAGAAERERVAANPLGNSFGWDSEPKNPQYRNQAEFMVDTLRIPRKEANMRMKVARCIFTKPGMSTEGSAIPQPLLAKAVLSGEVNLESASLIARTVKSIDALPAPSPFEQAQDATADSPQNAYTPQEWARESERHLCENATQFGPDLLRKLAKKLEILADPDGSEPTERFLAQKQGAFYLGFEQNLHSVLLRMTQKQFEIYRTKTEAAIAPPPRSANTRDNHGEHNPFATPGTSEAGRSSMGIEPTYPQKVLQAFIGLLDTAELEFSAQGQRSTILATIDYESLFTRAAQDSPGLFQHSGAVSASLLREMACEADILPIVLNGASEPLDIGRAKRLFTRSQRMALAARDQGCIFPGCTAPLGICESHHVKHWKAHGGKTNVNNGALLCPYHHHVIHKGVWTLRVIDNLPWVIPPPWIDLDQRPTRNTYFTLGDAHPREAG